MTFSLTRWDEFNVLDGGLQIRYLSITGNIHREGVVDTFNKKLHIERPGCSKPVLSSEQTAGSIWNWLMNNQKQKWMIFFQTIQLKPYKFKLYFNLFSPKAQNGKRSKLIQKKKQMTESLSESGKLLLLAALLAKDRIISNNGKAFLKGESCCSLLECF